MKMHRIFTKSTATFLIYLIDSFIHLTYLLPIPGPSFKSFQIDLPNPNFDYVLHFSHTHNKSLPFYSTYLDFSSTYYYMAGDW